MIAQQTAKKKALYEHLLFKVLERISRYYRLIIDIEYSNRDYYSDIALDLKDCLLGILSSVIDENLPTEPPETEDILDKKNSQMLFYYSQLAELHNQLKFLPRTEKPVEILQFKRLFYDALKDHFESIDDFSIDVGDSLSHEIHLRTPVSEFRDKILNQKRKKFIENIKQENGEKEVQTHITLPRVELRNPIGWAVLGHEIAHKVIDLCIPGEKNYYEHFKNYLNQNSLVTPEGLTDEQIQNRILEYWCDFIGILIMGHVAWFSQYDAMLFAGFNLNGAHKYPPDSLRLWLIRKILKHRFGHLCIPELDNIFDQAVRKLKLICSLNSCEPSDSDYDLAVQFFDYLTHEYIYRNENSAPNLAPALNSLVEKFISELKSLEDFTSITQLVEILESGVPIPSVRISADSLQEERTTIQKILLSGLIFRESQLQNTILNEFKSILSLSTSPKGYIDLFMQEISAPLGEFDSCLLRSIQLSEYIPLLKRKIENTPDIDSLANRIHQHKLPTTHSFTVLNDVEIRERLLSRSIKFIPLIDEQQIGSTSLDVRLGTSFQVYQPNQSGILDFLSEESQVEAEKNSVRIDLEYLQGIVLAPGQFVLGHTLEYIVLPSDIAAELEGRSTYARLGIEIHMTAGFVDPGFNGVLTLEFFNAGPNPVRLFPGLRVGQLRFFQCSPPAIPYNKKYKRKSQAKYSGLLAHAGSMHFKDYEISNYRNLKNQS